jgi:hypothetical protein
LGEIGCSLLGMEEIAPDLTVRDKLLAHGLAPQACPPRAGIAPRQEAGLKLDRTDQGDAGVNPVLGRTDRGNDINFLNFPQRGFAGMLPGAGGRMLRIRVERFPPALVLQLVGVLAN